MVSKKGKLWNFCPEIRRNCLVKMKYIWKKLRLLEKFVKCSILAYLS